ncbi:MAG: hypothetical protein AAGF12_43925, partial [Myxococcota bacterium]
MFASAQKVRDVRATPGFVVHEWGVWKIELGRPTYLEELAAESPGFVHRNNSAPPSQVIHTPLPAQPIPTLPPPIR